MCLETNRSVEIYPAREDVEIALEDVGGDDSELATGLRVEEISFEISKN
jgi:hypothetical protein